MDTPYRGEQQCDGVLCHGAGRIGRDVNDVDLSESGLHIHVIVACRAKRDQLHAIFIQLFDHLPVYGIVDKYANGGAVPGQRHRVPVQLRLQKPELYAAHGPEVFKRRLVISLRIKKRNLNQVHVSFATIHTIPLLVCFPGSEANIRTPGTGLHRTTRKTDIICWRDSTYGVSAVLFGVE